VTPTMIMANHVKHLINRKVPNLRTIEALRVIVPSGIIWFFASDYRNDVEKTNIR
jgi:hypothetical protein